MATGPAQVTFSSGGIVISGASLTAANIVSTGKITGGFTKAPPAPEPCNNRRGGPHSKIFCEVPQMVPHDIHAGRGRGRWFSWKDREID